MTREREIWVAETDLDGLIWGDSYDEMNNTTKSYFSPRKIQISEKTYEKINATDGDECRLYYLKYLFGKYVAVSY